MPVDEGVRDRIDPTDLHAICLLQLRVPSDDRAKCVLFDPWCGIRQRVQRIGACRGLIAIGRTVAITIASKWISARRYLLRIGHTINIAVARSGNTRTINELRNFWSRKVKEHRTAVAMWLREELQSQSVTQIIRKLSQASGDRAEHHAKTAHVIHTHPWRLCGFAGRF